MITLPHSARRLINTIKPGEKLMVKRLMQKTGYSAYFIRGLLKQIVEQGVFVKEGYFYHKPEPVPEINYFYDEVKPSLAEKLWIVRDNPSVRDYY